MVKCPSFGENLGQAAIVRFVLRSDSPPLVNASHIMHSVGVSYARIPIAVPASMLPSWALYRAGLTDRGHALLSALGCSRWEPRKRSPNARIESRLHHFDCARRINSDDHLNQIGKEGFWHFRLDLLATGLTRGFNWGRRGRANDPKSTKPVRHEPEKERF